MKIKGNNARAHQRMLEQTMTLYVQNVNMNGTMHLKDLSPLYS
jgi:hypothetical protein